MLIVCCIVLISRLELVHVKLNFRHVYFGDFLLKMVFKQTYRLSFLSFNLLLPCFESDTITKGLQRLDKIVKDED